MFLSLYTMFIIFAVISAVIYLFTLNHIKRKEPIANVLLGLHIALIGMFILFIAYNTIL